MRARDRAHEQVRRHGQRLRDLLRSRVDAARRPRRAGRVRCASGPAPTPRWHRQRPKPARGRWRGAGAAPRSDRDHRVHRTARGRARRRRRPAPTDRVRFAAAARTGPAAAGRTTGTGAPLSGNAVAPFACTIHVTEPPTRQADRCARRGAGCDAHRRLGGIDRSQQHGGAGRLAASDAVRTGRDPRIRCTGRVDRDLAFVDQCRGIDPIDGRRPGDDPRGVAARGDVPAGIGRVPRPRRPSPA